MNKMNLNEIVKVQDIPCDENVGYYFKVLFNYYALTRNGRKWCIKIAKICQILAASFDDPLDEIHRRSFDENVAYTNTIWKATSNAIETVLDQTAQDEIFYHAVDVYAFFIRYLIVIHAKLSASDARSIYFCRGNTASGCSGRFVPNEINCQKCLGFTDKAITSSELRDIWNERVSDLFAFTENNSQTTVNIGGVAVNIHETYVRTIPPPVKTIQKRVAPVNYTRERLLESPQLPTSVQFPRHVLPAGKVRAARPSVPAVQPTASTLMDLLTNMSGVSPDVVFEEYTNAHMRIETMYIAPLEIAGLDIVRTEFNGETVYSCGDYRIVPDHLQKCGATTYFLQHVPTRLMQVYKSVDEICEMFLASSQNISSPATIAETALQQVEFVPDTECLQQATSQEPAASTSTCIEDHIGDYGLYESLDLVHSANGNETFDWNDMGYNSELVYPCD